MTPPRLHILTATRTAYAVILRRGPARHVASIGWNRATDVFETGQWLRGRIYEHRSDLSPDGRHMIYFAGNTRSIARSTWYTAISRAPWLHALVFLPQNGTWYGGGAFTDNGDPFLNGGGALPRNGEGLKQAHETALPHGTDGFHMGGLHAAAQVRRGWSILKGARYETTLVRRVRDGWNLELRFRSGARTRSMISNVYSLVSSDGVRLEQPDWEWADIWKNGLHFAAKGSVCFTRLRLDGTFHETRLIRDFSDMTFERLRAPYDTRPPDEHVTWD